MGKCYFNVEWLSDRRYSDWLSSDDTDKSKFFCKSCRQSLNIGSSGIKALNSHMSSLRHATCHGSVMHSKSILNFTTRPTAKSSNEKEKDTSNNSVAPSAHQSTLRVSDNDVLKAEILWALHVISSYSSARSSIDMGALFKVMFPGHPVAEKFKCSRTKLGYLTAFGIAPAVKGEIMNSVKNSDAYVILFDESLNPDLQKKQLDVHVRFVDVDGTVKTRYIDSYFLGHATANDIVLKLNETVSNIDNENMLQLSMDGPNVNWKVFKEISASMSKKQDKNLLNIGSCSLHVFHNSIKAGLKECGWEIDNLLRSLYYLFHDSPARRDDFLSCTDCKLLPLKFCGHRWLENIPAAQRAIAIWPYIVSYVEKAKKGEVNEPTCKSFKVLMDYQSDRLIIAKIQSFIYICNILKPFLLRFQKDEPLVPFLTKEIGVVIRNLYSLILKQNHLDEMTELVVPQNIDKTFFKSQNRIEVGCHAEKILSAEKKKLSELQMMDFRLSFKKLVVACIKKLVEKTPVQISFAKNLECFDPALIVGNSPKARDLLKKTASHLQACGWISPEEMDQCLIEYSTFREVISKHPFSSTDRLDNYYLQLCNLDDVPALKKTLKIVLVLSHGQAEVERGFSVNKEVTVENLLEESLVARRLVCQFVKGRNVCDIVVSKEMLVSCGRAWQKYSEAMELKKKEAEMSEERLKRKRKHEEIQNLVSKKKKLELDMEILLQKADALNEKAEGAAARPAHEMIVQSNAMRRDARAKKESVKDISSLIVEKEEELKLL